MAKAIYNPKHVNTGGEKKENKAAIKGFVWSHARWGLGVNELKKFPDEVGAALLKHFSFLEEVTSENIKDVKEQMKERQYKCKYCDFETNTKVAFLNHVKTHKLSKEDEKMLDEISEAEAEGMVGKPSKRRLSPENQEGIPTGGTKSAPKSDRDGVSWYGGGLQKDSLADMRVRKPGQSPGHFGG